MIFRLILGLLLVLNMASASIPTALRETIASDRACGYDQTHSAQGMCTTRPQTGSTVRLRLVFAGTTHHYDGFRWRVAGAAEQFTGKERDAETGLDYFGARYFSGAQGRFTSPDPVIVTPARMIDPQRFNLYAYARNNPFKFIDPNGEDIELVNDTEEGRKKALALITKNMKANEAANIGIRQKKDGSYEAYVVDKKAIGKDASAGYKQVAGLINDHSIVADVGVVGGGLTATFKDLGRVSSFSEHSAVMEPGAGSKHVSVLVTQGDVPGGTQVWCCGGKGVYQGWQPDFVTMYHELVGETLKYRAGYGYLRKDPTLDNRTVIKIENEIRQFHGMSPRTGADHGMPVITVQGKVQ
jgi:RHS repeat-associated protein